MYSVLTLDYTDLNGDGRKLDYTKNDFPKIVSIVTVQRKFNKCTECVIKFYTNCIVMDYIRYEKKFLKTKWRTIDESHMSIVTYSGKVQSSTEIQSDIIDTYTYLANGGYDADGSYGVSYGSHDTAKSYLSKSQIFAILSDGSIIDMHNCKCVVDVESERSKTPSVRYINICSDGNKNISIIETDKKNEVSNIIKFNVNSKDCVHVYTV